MRIRSTLLTLSLALALPAAAIELSLEENKAERGNIGYIDMQRLFKTFPETIRAKDNFEELLRQAEEQLNLRKFEILRLRNEVSQLKIERDFLAKTPIDVPKKTAPPPARPVVDDFGEPSQAPASTAPVIAPQADLGRRGREPETDLTRPSIASLPGFGSDENSREAAEQAKKAAEARKNEPLVINIPGVSTSPVVVQPPALPAPPPVALSTPTANPALLELDAKIALKTKELAAKELEHKQQQAAAEKNLVDLESRRTEILLGKINRAVQEIARREGVSVVVDKNSILYGHDAVDLTEKVVKYLKGS